jgi:hypothetical protein
MSHPASVQFVDDTRTSGEWLQAAEALAQRLVHADARTAYARVRAGEYEGTPFAAELSQLMFLAGEDQPLPHAAE